MKKTQFFAAFLVAFAALLIIWSKTPVPGWYADGLVKVAGTLGPMVHGWVLEPPPAGQQHPVWVHGEDEVQASMQFDALAVGVVPLLALLAATPGVPLRRRLLRMGLGALINFAVLATIVAMFPLLVFYKNAFTDVVGTFLGLVAFVGAPVIIWFGLSFRELRQILPSFAPPSAAKPALRKERRHG